jgi:hypothetical protein
MSKRRVEEALPRGVAADNAIECHETRRWKLGSGSINEVGVSFHPFRNSNLEMVAQIFPRWNPLTSWMRQIEDFQRAA